jgi:hypothetical protein
LNTLRRENPGLIELQRAAYVERNSEGVTRLHQGSQLTERGPVAGAWTSLIGLLLASADTAGASAPLVDYGIDDAFAQQVATELAPGRSALFALLTDANAAEVRRATAPYGGEGRPFCFYWPFCVSRCDGPPPLVLEVTLSSGAVAPLRPSLRAGGVPSQLRLVTSSTPGAQT